MGGPETAILEGLTPPQRSAVTALAGPVLVLAGPGSGKTTVVTRRIAYLIDQGIPPWQILALTFTNKAAGEMRERIAQLVSADLPGRRGLTIATFHAFCARLLRRYGAVAGVSERFSIYDTADQRAAIKQALKAAELDDRNFSPAALAAAISNAKNRLETAEDFAGRASDFYHRCIARAYAAYEKILRANDAVDFDDLLLLTARLLRRHDAVRAELQARYQYLLVDEYQDTNNAQFTIAGALASGHRNLCVVGDPDQSIYGWRGADIRNILDFERQYPEAEVIALGQNFRSTGHIVTVADHLIRNNRQRKHKTLFTELDDGERPLVACCRDEVHEAAFVVDELRRRHQEDGVPWKEMAVLYRMNALSRVLEEAFRDGQTPYVIARGTAFYDRKEIKDALSFLRLILNPNDEVALRRIVNTPSRGIGRTTLDRVESLAVSRGLRFMDALRQAGTHAAITARAAKGIARFVEMVDGWQALASEVPSEPAVALAALVERVVHESGLEGVYRESGSDDDRERSANLEELINAAAQFEPAAGADEEDAESVADRLAALLESVALVSDADRVDPANGAVTLMTLHAAKGLEFDVVAIVGLEEGLLPHARANDSEADLEEERRLCFVGITRARRFLMLCHAGRRTHRGIREWAIESRFVGELPGEAIVRRDEGGGDGFDDCDEFAADARNKPDGRHVSLRMSFPAGALVRHPTFGIGRIEAILPRPAGSTARVTFETSGTKTLILEYARLERLD